MLKILFTVAMAGLLLPAWAAPVDTKAGGGGATYSIHVASFKGLKNANAFVNAFQMPGKAVFWKKMAVRGKGTYYRIFIGHYGTYADAEKDWLQLKSKGKVTYKGIFCFPDLVPRHEVKTVEAAAKPRQTMIAATKAPTRTGTSQVASSQKVPVEPGPQAPAETKRKAAPDKRRITDSRKGRGAIVSGAQPKTPVSRKKQPIILTGRFVDNQDGTVTDRLNGLMWIQSGWHREFIAATTWDEAIDKCDRFEAGGYSDWTLPTRVQWESLLDPTLQAPAIVEPNPFKNIIIHMPYWAKDGPVRLLSRRYTTLLYTGSINHQLKHERAFVWPVRVIR
jgi:hypothetical protein